MSNRSLACTGLVLLAASPLLFVNQSQPQAARRKDSVVISHPLLSCDAWAVEGGIEIEGNALLHNRLDEECFGWALEVAGTRKDEKTGEPWVWRRQYRGSEFLVFRDTVLMPWMTEVVKVPGDDLYDVKVILYQPMENPRNETWLEFAQYELITSTWVKVE